MTVLCGGRRGAVGYSRHAAYRLLVARVNLSGGTTSDYQPWCPENPADPRQRSRLGAGHSTQIRQLEKQHQRADRLIRPLMNTDPEECYQLPKSCTEARDVLSAMLSRARIVGNVLNDGERAPAEPLKYLPPALCVRWEIYDHSPENGQPSRSTSFLRLAPIAQSPKTARKSCGHTGCSRWRTARCASNCRSSCMNCREATTFDCRRCR